MFVLNVLIVSDRPEDTLLNVIANGLLGGIYTLFRAEKHLYKKKTEQRKDASPSIVVFPRLFIVLSMHFSLSLLLNGECANNTRVNQFFRNHFILSFGVVQACFSLRQFHAKFT